MVTNRTSRRSLLRSLLEPFVREWGATELRECIQDIEADSESRRSDLQLHIRADEGRKHERPSAASMVARASLPLEQKRLIEALAASFDSKEFLPSAGDIRNFFEVHGETVPVVKQRVEAFRKILKLLSTMSNTALQKLAEEDTHRGPSRLGPLSAAMREVGEQRGAEQSIEAGKQKETVDLSNSPGGGS